MKVIHYYLLLALLGCSTYVPTRYKVKIEKEPVVSGHQLWAPKDTTTSLFSRFAYDDEWLNRFPTYQALAGVEVYLKAGKTPFTPSITPLRFIEALRQRNVSFQIRNGELEALSKRYTFYQEKLDEFYSLLDSIGGDPMQSKRQYKNQICQYPNPKKMEAFWPFFKQKRKETWKSFRQFRNQLKLTYETERALIRQYLYHPQLFDSINQFENTNGEPLATYVFTRKQLFHENSALGKLAGLVVMSKEDGLFSSDTPTVRRDFPVFTGRRNSLAVFLNEEASGAIVSHEFGHLYYLYHHWDEYLTYIKEKGCLYVTGGHGQGDPSGEAAILAELGKMPRVEKQIDLQEEEPIVVTTADK